MFCNVCKQAGKSEEMYTSHYVKDQPGPNGVVVCPTLLSQNCRYCGDIGHTPKYCPKITETSEIKRTNDTKRYGRPKPRILIDDEGFTHVYKTSDVHEEVKDEDEYANVEVKTDKESKVVVTNVNAWINKLSLTLKEEGTEKVHKEFDVSGFTKIQEEIKEEQEKNEEEKGNKELLNEINRLKKEMDKMRLEINELKRERISFTTTSSSAKESKIIKFGELASKEWV